MDPNADPNGEASTAAIKRAYHADEMSERELAILGLHAAVILAGLQDPWPIRQRSSARSRGSPSSE
jgi:hypothetical protein